MAKSGTRELREKLQQGMSDESVTELIGWYSRVLAPEEQHVYSSQFHMCPAPSGAACKLNGSEAHGAPLERTVISG